MALCDTDRERLRGTGARFGVARLYSAAEELLEVPEVELVLISVPPRAHTPLALAALASQKSVYLEKPMCLTSAEAKLLVHQLRNPGGHLWNGFNLRAHPHVVAARAHLGRAAAGRIRLIRSSFMSSFGSGASWRRRAEEGGSVLFDLGVHHFDLWRCLLAAEVDEVQATATDGVVTVHARMSSGAVVGANFSFELNDANDLELWGEQGCLRLSLYRFDGFDFQSSRCPPWSLGWRTERLTALLAGLRTAWRTKPLGGVYPGSFTLHWRQCLAGLRTGSPSPAGVDDGWRAVAIALAAERSLSSGQAERPEALEPVSLSPWPEAPSGS